MLTAFSSSLIAKNVRVYPPKRYVLVCGGEVTSILEPQPVSLRDALLKGGAVSSFKRCEILQIEEMREFFEKNCLYNDLVKFECDIAQICELVLLFSESPGSFAELGSFTAISEVNEKLLLVIQSKYTTKSNFIAKGPVQNLDRDYPHSVFTITDAAVGIISDDISKVDCKTLVDTLVPAIDIRLREVEERSSFDKSKFSHICKLYVGILREAYCLKDDELQLLFLEFGVSLDIKDLDKIAFCCAALKWSGTIKVGFDRIHFAMKDLNEAAKIEFDGALFDKTRRRSEFRRFWEENDASRVAAVDQEAI